MTNQTSRLTLGEHLGMGAIGPLLEKRTFGGYNVRLGPFIMRSLWMFVQGAALGRALRDRLEILVRLLVPPGHEYDFCVTLNEKVALRVSRYGKEPDSFFDFWFRTQFQNLDFLDLDALKRITKRKVRLGEMLPLLNEWLVQGIGFGAKFPELTERLWRKEYETPEDADLWAILRQAGLDIPEEQTLLPLDEMEEMVLLGVAIYVDEFMPELLEPLGLPHPPPSMIESRGDL